MERRRRTERPGAARSLTAVSTSIYPLRIELRDLKPAIWRTVLVPGSITLDKLHRVFQIVMGWTNSHLHEFTIGSARYGIPDPDFPDEPALHNEKRATLSDCLASAVQAFSYLYDFGDDWEHTVRVEKVVDADPAVHYPVCVDGANACPPEDVGGPDGYLDFLHAVSDPKHPEHRAMIEWHGGPFDPRALNVKPINARLARLKV